jgi:hypothetical protein
MAYRLSISQFWNEDRDLDYFQSMMAFPYCSPENKGDMGDLIQAEGDWSDLVQKVRAWIPLGDWYILQNPDQRMNQATGKNFAHKN